MKIQGIKKYHDKESYIVEILKNKKEIFNGIIGTNIKNIYSEVRLNNNKIRVDLIGKTEEEPLIFVEVSIRNNCLKDFITHRDQLINILKIIGKEKFAHIVLMSPSFINEDIKDIENLIAYYNVKIYFVYMPMELALKLQDNTNINDKEKRERLYNAVTVSKCIKIASKNINMNKKFILDFSNEECGNYIAKAILKGLRKEMYWHLPIHRYKDLRKNIIKVGTGTSDIILYIYCNMRNKIKIQVDFAQRISIFNIFKDYMADMSDEIGKSIYISTNNHQIYTEIPILKNESSTVSTTIITVKRYIKYITKMYTKIQI